MPKSHLVDLGMMVAPKYLVVVLALQENYNVDFSNCFKC